MRWVAGTLFASGWMLLWSPLAAAQQPGSSSQGIVRPDQPPRPDRSERAGGADRRLPRIILDRDDERGRDDRWRGGDRDHDDHARGDGDRGRRRGPAGHRHRHDGIHYPPLVFPYDHRYPNGGFGFGFGYDSYAIPPLDGRWQAAPWYPQSVLLDSRVVPNPPLPPVEVQLRNTAARDLHVALIDLQDSSVVRSMQLRSGESAGVRLARDSGATRISQYRTYDAWGYPVIEEVVTPIPPEPLYEAVVHEWAVQSVAIDRTGKSPSPIEDINMQGRGIGRFVLPAGNNLQPGTIDVYRLAKAANNPGAVAPLVPEERLPGSRGATPPERAILEAQRRAQSNRQP